MAAMWNIFAVSRGCARMGAAPVVLQPVLIATDLFSPLHPTKTGRGWEGNESVPPVPAQLYSDYFL